MQVVFPDILKKNKNEWSFSDDEPWKPVANDDASDEVKKAIAEFISEINVDTKESVAKTFDEIITGADDVGVDEEIDLVVSTWTDTDGIYAEVEKGNPYHDPATGKFTTGHAGGNPMIRTGPPPKNTKIAYKVFVAKDGKLYPPMVANPDGQDTPVGVWLNASEGTLATDKDGNPITNTLGRNKVKAGGKGTQGGSGTLAYRPGWHLGELPIAEQFYTKDKATGERKQKKNFVWAECEIAADFDYQTEAMSYGYNKNGKFQHSLAGLPKIPTDGYYTYRTNPDPKTKPWYITGAMKVNRILTDAETNSILRANGIEPMKRMGGELDLAALGFTDTNFVGKSASEENSFNIFKTDEDKRLVFGWASIALTVDGEQLEDRQQDMIDPEDLEEAAYEYVLNFRDTGEEHIPTMRKKGKLVESCVFTAEKQKAMGIPEGTVPVGWWIGFKISDDDAWNRVKSGHYKMFSIEGKANRLPVEKSDPEETTITKGDRDMNKYDHIEEVSVAKTFDEIVEVKKFNPYHDAKGRFSSANGAASFTYSPGKSKAHDMAIAREQTRSATAASSTDTSDAAREIAGGKHNSLEGYLDENGNLTPEREAVHQEIINKMLHDKIPVEGQATMTMLGGGPASGKSSVLNPDTSGDPHSVTIDPDAMKAMLPGYKEMAAQTSDAASYYHEESSALAKRFYEVAVSRNLNAIYDGTGDGSESSVQKKIDTAKAAGHKVVAKYVTIDTETAVARNQKRYDDAVAEGKTPRLVPADYVRATHAKVTDISVAKASSFDEIEIWDNNGARGQQKLIAKGGSGSGLKAIDRDAFQKFLDKGNSGHSINADGSVN